MYENINPIKYPICLKTSILPKYSFSLATSVSALTRYPPKTKVSWYKQYIIRAEKKEILYMKNITRDIIIRNSTNIDIIKKLFIFNNFL